MIVKIERYNKFESYDKEIIFNVKRATTFIGPDENIMLSVEITNKEEVEFIPLTYTDKNNNHPSLVSAVWLMNNEGKTIERLI